MGWMYTYRPKGQSIKDFFSQRFNYTRENGRYSKVLECSATFRVAYMAYEIGDPEEGKKIIALVCLLHHCPCDRNYNFGYKDMDESMGPVESECPEKILKLLTPTEGKYALEWREQCWNNLKRKKACPKLKPGMAIKTNAPFKFTDGSTVDSFRVRSLRPLRLARADSVSPQARYRLSHKQLKATGYTLIEEEKRPGVQSLFS
jgi:hypothetical protein